MRSYIVRGARNIIYVARPITFSGDLGVEFLSWNPVGRVSLQEINLSLRFAHLAITHHRYLIRIRVMGAQGTTIRLCSLSQSYERGFKNITALNIIDNTRCAQSSLFRGLYFSYLVSDTIL